MAEIKKEKEIPNWMIYGIMAFVLAILTGYKNNLGFAGLLGAFVGSYFVIAAIAFIYKKIKYVIALAYRKIKQHGAT